MSKAPKNLYKDHPVLGVRPKKPLTLEETRDVLAALCAFHGISEKDPAALGKLAICLARQFVPALRPRKAAGRPRNHSPHDMMWVLVEYNQMKRETGLSSNAAIIKKMAEDEFWQDPDIGLGGAEEEVLQALRYILTDRIKRPDIAPLVREEVRKFVAALEATKKSQRH